MSRVLFPAPPLGIALLAGSLRAAGHRVWVYDLVHTPLRLQKLLDLLKEQDVEVVAYSIVGPSFFWVQSFAEKLRNCIPQVLQVAGNVVPSEYPQWVFSQIPSIDIIVRGEGEVALIDALNGGTGGGAVLRRGDSIQPGLVHQLADLDGLPRPAWDLMNLQRYRSSPQLLFGGRAIGPLLQSRGCPWSCAYCAQNFAWDKVRFRSIESIVEEMHWIYSDFGVSDFGFYDSIFPLKEEFGEALLTELGKRSLLGKIRFGLESRVDMIWPSTFQALRRAGLHFVMLGIESAGNGPLRRAGKLTREYPVETAVATLKKLGVRAYGLFMIGFPGETDEDRIRTRELLLKLPLDMASIGIYSVYAGSPDARAQMAGDDPSRFLTSNFYFDHKRKEVAALQQQMLRDFFLRPKIIYQTLANQNLSLSDLIRGGLALLRG